MPKQRSNGHSISRLTVHIVWSTGNITDEMVNEYSEHHRRPGDGNAMNLMQ